MKERLSQFVPLVIGLVILVGCHAGRVELIPSFQDQYEFEDLATRRPITRIGSLPSSALVGVYSKSTKLGNHGYSPNGSERNGIIYTCRGGHIDLAHLRNVVDWTGYSASESYRQIMNGNEKYSFQIGGEGVCHVEIEYPSVWKYHSKEGKEIVARRISSGLGEYFAYQYGVWHEIVTWFGYKSAWIFPEYKSAFSWEDSYSNLLGSHIGYIALNDNKHDFNQAVTIAIDGYMENLGIQSAKVAKRSAKKMRSRTCKDYVSIANYKTRNFDVGLDDGYLTPWVISCPGGCKDSVAQSLDIPTLDFLDKYGFSVKFKIEPKVWEKGQILQIVYGEDYRKKKFLEPDKHFGTIVAHIEQMAMERYGQLKQSEDGGQLTKKDQHAHDLQWRSLHNYYSKYID